MNSNAQTSEAEAQAALLAVTPLLTLAPPMAPTQLPNSFKQLIRKIVQGSTASWACAYDLPAVAHTPDLIRDWTKQPATLTQIIQEKLNLLKPLRVTSARAACQGPAQGDDLAFGSSDWQIRVWAIPAQLRVEHVASGTLQCASARFPLNYAVEVRGLLQQHPTFDPFVHSLEHAARFFRRRARCFTKLKARWSNSVRVSLNIGQSVNVSQSIQANLRDNAAVLTVGPRSTGRSSNMRGTVVVVWSLIHAEFAVNLSSAFKTTHHFSSAADPARIWKLQVLTPLDCATSVSAMAHNLSEAAVDHGPAQAIFRLVRAATDASVCNESTSPYATTSAQNDSVQSARSSSVEHSTPRLTNALADDLSIDSSGSELFDSDDDNRTSVSEQGGASSSTASSDAPSTVAGASESTYGSSAQVGSAVAAVPENDSDAGSTLPLGQSGSRVRQRRVTFSDMPVVSDAPALSASSPAAVTPAAATPITIDSEGHAAQLPTRRRSTHATSVRLSIQLAPPPSRGGQTAVRPATAPNDAQISQPATAAVPGKILVSGDRKPSNEHPGAVTTSRRRSGRAGSRPRNPISLVAPMQHRSIDKSSLPQRIARDSNPAENSQIQFNAEGSDGITTVRSPPPLRLDMHAGRRRRDHGTAGQPDRKRLAISLVPPKR